MVPRQKGKSRGGSKQDKAHEKRLKEVLKEIRDANRPNEPNAIDLQGIYSEPVEVVYGDEEMEHIHRQMKREIVYPYSSLILCNAEQYATGAGLKDFEKVRGAKGDDDTRCMAIAVKASHASVGISRGDIEQQLHAFKSGKLCGKELPNGDTKYLVSAAREACGRYRLTYTRTATD
ncbi:unnamed protein product [Vitrella brassicaformis CCMP3155]|uniref:Uncharacterized protein n=1 Tax=Vitrella brassicaformis (strain CCMP3155) TaxID=1169540 RepID=A0A0G4EVT7_VITBC|nr:unnamed protein product [Vitrella brassicaformis CCMP3155]|eukprot:CEM02425.1 unnamed protein product [Vitrella brassicaformis CCMP3155]